VTGFQLGGQQVAVRQATFPAMPRQARARLSGSDRARQSSGELQ
jgi:hypothetical protein